MSRDDPPDENLDPICILFLDTQICVDDNGTISVYTGASSDESDDGFRHVGSSSSVVGSYFDSVEDIKRRLREWADENRDRIDACVLSAKEIASLSARVRHLEVSLAAAEAALKVGLPAGPPPKSNSEEGRWSDDKIKNNRRPLLTDPGAWFVSESDRIALLAERIARVQFGGNSWRATSEQFRLSVALIWIEHIKTIRRAGLELVEREDGR